MIALKPVVSPLGVFLLISLVGACGTGDPAGMDTSDSSDSSDSMSATDSTDSSDSSDSSDATDTDGVVPTVIATIPADNEVDVALNASISISFSEAMDAQTLSAMTFSVSGGDPPVPVDGMVIYADSTAVFWPSAHLPSDTSFEARVTTDAQSSFGVGLAEDYSWTFTTGTELEPGMGVDLGEASDFVILSKAGISTVPLSSIVGNLGVSPAAATYITGFSLTVDASNAFALSSQVTGKVYASDYGAPTPTYLTTAVGDMELAFTDANGRAPDVTELGAGNIGGLTLEPGVYKWGTGLLIPTDITLEGSGTDVWIFQIAGDLTMESGANVLMSGGALPENVFWSVSGFVDVGTTAHVEGNILAMTSVTLRTGASIQGRLLAQSAVDIDNSTVVEPMP